MSDNLYSDLKYCGELLGQNDLEGNNLSNQLDLIKKIFDYIHYSNSDLGIIEDIADELIQELGSDNSLTTKIQLIQYKVKNLESKIKNLQAIEFGISQITLGKIMGNNLAAFLVISRLIRNH